MTTPEDITPGNSDPEVNPAGDGVDVSDGSTAQGRWGVRTLTIMVVSLVLAIVVVFGVFGLHAGRVGTNGGPGGGGQEGVNKAAQAQVFNAPQRSPKQNPAPDAVQAATPGS